MGDIYEKAISGTINIILFRIFHPIYEQYKLKNDVKYAVQRYCSLKELSSYSIQPINQDYELCECGVLVGEILLNNWLRV